MASPILLILTAPFVCHRSLCICQRARTMLGASGKRMTNDLVRQMLTQIENDYSQAITLRTMSAAIGRQPAYLGRLFQQEVGASVRDHLTRVRLEHAAELIRDGVKIEAVALCVGYRSKKNFYQR